jgi:hypothetical protein
MGQMMNPPHVKAMRDFILGLKKLGLSQDQIDWMARKTRRNCWGWTRDVVADMILTRNAAVGYAAKS